MKTLKSHAHTHTIHIYSLNRKNSPFSHWRWWLFKIPRKINRQIVYILLNTVCSNSFVIMCVCCAIQIGDFLQRRSYAQSVCSIVCCSQRAVPLSTIDFYSLGGNRHNIRNRKTNREREGGRERTSKRASAHTHVVSTSFVYPATGHVAAVFARSLSRIWSTVNTKVATDRYRPSTTKQPQNQKEQVLIWLYISCNNRAKPKILNRFWNFSIQKQATAAL